MPRCPDWRCARADADGGACHEEHEGHVHHFGLRAAVYETIVPPQPKQVFLDNVSVRGNGGG